MVSVVNVEGPMCLSSCLLGHFSGFWAVRVACFLWSSPQTDWVGGREGPHFQVCRLSWQE